jgi:hypothetical protein
MTISLTIGAALELGIINSEKVSVDAQLFEQPMPGSPASSTVLMDLFGVVKIIDLEGTFITGTGGLTIKTFNDQFIDDTTGKIKGDQTAGTYVSDSFTTSISVIIKSFTYTYEEGNPSSIKYRLQLQEGTVT